jgi:hypothetical protein
MTKVNPPIREVGGPDPTAAIEALLLETAEEVRRLLAQVKAGDFGKADALAREQVLLRRALASSIQERQKVENLRSDSETDVPYPALDLAAARDEIGRRLARLRVVADAEEISGDAE